MNFRTFFLFFVFCFLFFLSAGSAYAVAVTPARIEVEYIPGREEPLSLMVSDVDNLDVAASGDGAEGLKPFDIKRDGRVYYVTTSIVFPPNMTPGPKELSLLFTEKADASGMLSVQARIRIPVIFVVPFDGKYLNVQHVEWTKRVMRGAPFVFTVQLKNFGKTTVEIVQGTLVIASDANKEIKYKVPFTTQKGIKHNGLTEIHAEWEPPENATLGPYTLTPQVVYDDIPLKLQEYYTLYGDLFVDIASTDFSALYAGKISPVTITAKSYWGKETKVDAKVDITDSTGAVVASAQSPTTPLKLFAQQGLTFFVDATKLTPARYTANVVLAYEGKETEKTVAFDLQNDPVESTESTKEQPSSTGQQSTALILGISLLVLAILLVLYTRFRRN